MTLGLMALVAAAVITTVVEAAVGVAYVWVPVITVVALSAGVLLGRWARTRDE